MKHVALTHRHTPLYTRACTFAERVYRETLCIHINHFPDTLAVITEDDAVLGCMGLNHAVTFDLFLNDPRYRRAVRKTPQKIRIGEQSVFAVTRFPAGVPILISTVAAYAQAIGIERIVYAGISVSRKTIEQLGFPVTELGPTNLYTLDRAGRENYRHWHAVHDPVSCILNTTPAVEICSNTLARFARKCAPDFELAAFLADTYETRPLRRAV